MLEYVKRLITPDMVSLWLPSGQSRAIDLIRSNHGQCYGTHPNVPVLPNLVNPSVGWHSDGVDDKVSADGVIADVDLTKTGAVTLGGWFNRTATSGTSYQGFCVDGSWNNSFLIKFDDTYVRGTMKGGGGTYPTVTDSIDYSGEWVHICVVKDGEDLELFVNGVSKGKDDTTGLSANIVVTSFDIGWAYSDTYAFNGYIVLPFVANAAWSVAQVKNFYNATKGFFAPR